MTTTGRADEFDRTPEYRKSKEVQQFKIGRIKYNLPQSLTANGDTYLLFFRLTGTLEWVAGYRRMLDFTGKNDLQLARESTFNKAIKSLHSTMKKYK